jgi:hypothetical protein
MKKLILSALAVSILSATGFSQMMEDMHEDSMAGQGGMQPYGYYIPQPMMMPMMMMPMMMGMSGGMMGMGGMGMMQDPEIMKIIQEHRMKCRKELMKKLAKRGSSSMAERMLRMMTMHPEAFKEALRKNPQLKKKLEELLK